MLIEVGAIFLTITRTSRRAVGSSKALDKFVILKFDVGAAINYKEVDVARCFELS